MSFPSSNVNTSLPSKNRNKVATFTPGAFIIPRVGEPFQIVSSTNRKEGRLYKIAYKNGDVKTIKGDSLTNLAKKTAGEIRLANLFKFFSYNQDFDLYVVSAIKEHGMPVDEKMHWSKWLESVFKSTVSQEERRDEAIHNMLIHTLFEIDILKNFDPSRLSETNQALPLAQQISSYLKNYFSYQKSKIVAWIDSTYGTSDELLIMDGGTPTEPGEAAPILEHGEMDEDQQSVIKRADLEKFRTLFTKWITKLSMRDTSRDRVLACMNIILDSPAMKSSQLITELATNLDISEYAAQRIFHKAFPGFVQKFLQTPEGKMLNTTEESGLLKQSNMEEPMRSRRADTTPYTQTGLSSPKPPVTSTGRPTPNTPPAPGAKAPTPAPPGQSNCPNCGTATAPGQPCPTCVDNNKKVSAMKRKKADEITDMPEKLSDNPSSKDPVSSMPEKVNPSFKKTPSAKDVEHTTLTVDNERKMVSMPGEPEGSKIKVTANKYATLQRIANEEPQELGHALNEITAAFASLKEASEALTENLNLTASSDDASLSEKVASRKKYAAALRRIAGENPEAVEEAVQELYHSLDEIAEAVENLASNLDIYLGVESDEGEDDLVDFEGGDVTDTAETMFDAGAETSEGESSEEGLDEFDEEIGANASDILDEYEEEKTSSRKRKRASAVVCSTQSGGQWTKYEAADADELAKFCRQHRDCAWDLKDPKYGKMYAPVFVLTESGEPVAAYSKVAGEEIYMDTDNMDASQSFGEELEELKGCLGE